MSITLPADMADALHNGAERLMTHGSRILSADRLRTICGALGNGGLRTPMMYAVVFISEAEAQFTVLCRYIAEVCSPGTAVPFVDAIVTYCERLAQFPQRGTS